MPYLIFNEQEALERVYDKELLKELLVDFSEMKELNWNIFEQHLKDLNYDELDHISHSIKGVSGNLSLTGIYLAATALNDVLRQHDISNIVTCLQELKAEVERFRVFLPEYLNC
jgi:HPt (histidine-containing phosphotransfer) domain-containing protein